ncbi:5'-tyrosyl-DNA phosphodiesterase [Rhypophila decipiens]|uniref:5'-tyrosyl-DNA phosphodiesterase n=1 Tax=Rhypophila decipiens TaxID=261697 RepID=A0AAN7B803_9PEZI|nr:5'-tyrosyl-DNA phosphodiesterase [Rhypophila decipiens]
MADSRGSAAWYGFDNRWDAGEPSPQPFFEFSDSSWTSRESLSTPESSTGNSQQLGQFTVLSWNIDMMRKLETPRMKGALAHLRTRVDEETEPPIIMLNEMISTHLDLMQSTGWIREKYRMTDITSANWEGGTYGTCMLVPRYLSIKQVFRVHYEGTRMGRDGLFVDINLSSNKTLRLCSTHLESLVIDPPKRPGQLASAAKYMHQADASVLAGDLNAIQPFDQTLHFDNDLEDAYLESGGQEGAEAGMTWGQMASIFQRGRFGLSRMDKVLFCGGLELISFGTFGMDVQVEREEDRLALTHRGHLEKGWVTDHLGVRAEFRVTV